MAAKLTPQEQVDLDQALRTEGHDGGRFEFVEELDNAMVFADGCALRIGQIDFMVDSDFGLSTGKEYDFLTTEYPCAIGLNNGRVIVVTRQVFNGIMFALKNAHGVGSSEPGTSDGPVC